jgi:hypothetical protein
MSVNPHALSAAGAGGSQDTRFVEAIQDREGKDDV